MFNELLYEYEQETGPTFGVLMADHFRRSYGFYGHRPRGTLDWLLVYTVSGTGSFRVDEEVLTSAAGDAVLLPPGIPHHYAANQAGEWELLWVHFLPLPEWQDYLQLPRTQEGLLTSAAPDAPIRARIEEAFRRLIADARRSSRAGQELALLSLAEILILLQESSSCVQGDRSAAAPALQDERITQTLRYIADHAHEPLSPAALARSAGLSESRFRHLFKAETGKSVSDWVTETRLHQAAKLLELTSRPVGEIAVYVGYESAYYFTRRFSAAFGMSPTAFRRFAEERRQSDTAD
ncbi:helix-turn-helix domain-containing protein [Paenibacillus rhizovicinus]|uniref:Helix-turn-helix domain-containing protein n=1 Tax=Paenibacillus rhizovicinus TaxID=2704463 RepID=A0A6C0NZW3_9BACL|nr:helix-turn-helix domain-containing protein [Paenibacillus rhizovicinus]QHW31810.1 helix-turn-helix domain-containing protein [Paenibacillus rhizovicinus]